MSQSIWSIIQPMATWALILASLTASTIAITKTKNTWALILLITIWTYTLADLIFNMIIPCLQWTGELHSAAYCSSNKQDKAAPELEDNNDNTNETDDDDDDEPDYSCASRLCTRERITDLRTTNQLHLHEPKHLVNHTVNSNVGLHPGKPDIQYGHNHQDKEHPVNSTVNSNMDLHPGRPDIQHNHPLPTMDW